MRVFFATNRDRVGGELIFNQYPYRGGDWIRFGWADCQFNDGPTSDPIITEHFIAPEQLHEDPEDPDKKRRIFIQAGSPVFLDGLTDYLKASQGQNGPRRDALIFIPGFDYSFKDSIVRAAFLASLYSSPSIEFVPVVFSWPSDGRLTAFAYRSDRRDAEISGWAIARAYAILLERVRKLRVTEKCNARLHLLAHSMGAYALRHATAVLGRSDFPAWPAPLFDTAILAAPDDDRDTLETDGKMGLLRRLAMRVDVYFNKNDKPVRIGDDVDGEIDRLGAYGPQNVLAAEARFTGKLNLIDCSEIADWTDDMTLHQYYRVEPRVIEDIRDVLHGILPANARHRPAAGYDPVRRCYVLS